MTDAVASISYSDVPGFPAGTSVGSIEVTVTPSGGTPILQSVAPGTTSVTFTGLADGNYTADAQAVGADDSLLGSPVSTTFTIASGGGGTVTLSLPSGLSVAQQ